MTLTGLGLGAAAALSGSSASEPAPPTVQLAGSLDRKVQDEVETLIVPFRVLDPTGARVDLEVRWAVDDGDPDTVADFPATIVDERDIRGVPSGDDTRVFLWDAQGDLAREIEPRGVSKVAAVVLSIRARRGDAVGFPTVASFVAGNTPPRVRLLPRDAGPATRIVAVPLAVADDAFDAIRVQIFLTDPRSGRRELDLRGPSQGIETFPEDTATEVFFDSTVAVGFRNVTATMEVVVLDRFGASAVTSQAIRIENDLAPLVQIVGFGAASEVAPAAGRIPIRFVLFDPEADIDPDGPSGRPAVSVEFSADRGASFAPATGLALRDGGRDLGLASLEGLRAFPVPRIEAGPGGNVHTFLWDSVADGLAGLGERDLLLRLRATEGGLESVASVATVRVGAATPGFGADLRVDDGEDLGAFGIAIGDIDGDGRPDLVTSDQLAGTFSVRLAAAGGGFRPAIRLPVPDNDAPPGVVLGDFDGDGDLDLAGPLPQQGRLAAYEYLGADTFGPVTVYGASAPIAIALGDLDGDGGPDVALADLDLGVDVRLGRPGGTFGPGPVVTAGETPISVAVGDLDGDWRLDIVALNGRNDDISIWLRGPTGDLVLQPAVPCAADSFPYALALGDLDSDGDLDLAVAEIDSDTLVIRLGLGDGRFGPERAFPTGRGPSAIALGDLDGDGLLDVAVTHKTNTVGVRIGLGAGALGPERRFALGSEPEEVLFGDVTGDGRLDLAAANSFSTFTSVLPGRTPGGLQVDVPLAAGAAPMLVRLADLNGDGRLDLVTGSDLFDNTDGLGVRLATAAGGFAEPLAVSGSGAVNMLAVGDVDGDGHLDALVANANTFGDADEVKIFPGRGDGSFGPARVLACPAPPEDVAIADTDGDGRMDIVVMFAFDDPIGVFRGGPDGSFTLEVVDVFVGGAVIVLADFDLDGWLDGVFTDQISAVELVFGRPGGGFEDESTFFSLAEDPVEVVAADLDGDGWVDLAAASNAPGEVAVRRGMPGRFFARPLRFPVGAGPVALASGDFDGDGRVDLAVACADSNEAVLALAGRRPGRGGRGPPARGRGDGRLEGLAFETAAAPLAGIPADIVAGDLSSDGIDDLAIGSPDFVEVAVSCAAAPSRAAPELTAVAPTGTAVRRLPARPIDPALAGPLAPSGAAVRMVQASIAETFTPEATTLATATAIALPLRSGLTAEELADGVFRVFREEPGLAPAGPDPARIGRFGLPRHDRVVEVARRTAGALPEGLVAATVDPLRGTLSLPVTRLGRYQAFLEAPTTTALIYRETFDALGPDSSGLAPRPPGFAGSGLWSCGAPSATAIARGERPAPASAPNLLGIGLRRPYPVDVFDGATRTALVASVSTTAFPLSGLGLFDEATVAVRFRGWRDLGPGDEVTLALVLPEAEGGPFRSVLRTWTGPGGGTLPPALRLEDVPASSAFLEALDLIPSSRLDRRAHLELTLRAGPGPAGRGFYLDDLEIVYRSGTP